MLLLLAMFQALPPQQAPRPKNDPAGIWQADDTKTKYEIKPTEMGIRVQIVAGSNPRYSKFELNLAKTDEVNTYKGAGSFVAKLSNGKECKFDVDWSLVVVQPELIAAVVDEIIPDPATCEVKERGSTLVQLKKTK